MKEVRKFRVKEEGSNFLLVVCLLSQGKAEAGAVDGSYKREWLADFQGQGVLLLFAVECRGSRSRCLGCLYRAEPEGPLLLPRPAVVGTRVHAAVVGKRGWQDGRSLEPVERHADDSETEGWVGESNRRRRGVVRPVQQTWRLRVREKGLLQRDDGAARAKWSREVEGLSVVWSWLSKGRRGVLCSVLEP